MPNMTFNPVDETATLEQLRDEVARLQRKINYLMNKGLDTDNIQKIAGWWVEPNEIRSSDGDVGMSTEDDGGDDVRFWAGSTDKDTAPWRVTKSGKMYATGATIQTSAGYPKIIIDPDTNLLKIMTDENKYIEVAAVEAGYNVPVMRFQDGSSGVLLYNIEPDGFTIVGIDNTPISISSTSGGIKLFGDVNVNGDLDVQGGTGGTYYVSATPGGPADTPISFTNGIKT